MSTSTLDQATLEAVLIAKTLGLQDGVHGEGVSLPEDPLLAEHLRAARRILDTPIGIKDLEVYNDDRCG